MWSGKPGTENPERCWDDGRWLETEWSEGLMTKRRETWATNKTVFMLVEPKKPVAQESEHP